MIPYDLTFFGDDGEFAEVIQADTDNIEWLFRNPRVHGLTWTFDGDGWTSSLSWFPEAKQAGHYYIARTI